MGSAGYRLSGRTDDPNDYRDRWRHIKAVAIPDVELVTAKPIHLLTIPIPIENPENWRALTLEETQKILPIIGARATKKSIDLEEKLRVWSLISTSIDNALWSHNQDAT